MKYLPILLFLLLAAPRVQAQTAVPATEATTEAEAEPAIAPERELTAKEADKRARKARRKGNGPEVYKGSLAQKRRIIIDAPEAEKEKDPEDQSDAQPAVAPGKSESSAPGKSKR